MQWRGWKWLGPGGALVGAIAALIVLRVSDTASEMPRVLAVALLLVCLHELWCRRALLSPFVERVRVPDRARRFAAWLSIGTVGPYLLLGVFAVIALWPASVGDMPIGQDHVYHYFGTRVLVDDLLSEGRVFGWTDRFCTGLPIGDVYASGAYLFSAAPHLLTFGAIPLRASYAFFIFGVWLVAALAVGSLSHRLVRAAPPSTDRWTWVAPLFAGGLFLIDPGGDRQGGWLYSMFYGVWPQYFGTTLLVVALLALLRLIERQTVSRFGLAILAVGAALWAHPMTAPNLMVLAPLLGLVMLLSRGLSPDDEPRGGPSAEPRRGAIWAAIATALGGVIGYSWFVHLIYASDHEFVNHHGNSWEPLADLGRRLLEGELFYNDPPWVAVLAVIGAIAVFRRAHRDGVIVLGAFCLFFVVCTMEPLLGYDFGIHPDHKGVMFSRFTITMKPFWYALGGVGAKVALDGARRYVGPALGRARYGLRVLSLLVVAPVLWAAWLAMPAYPDVPAAEPVTPITGELEDELEGLDRIFAAEADRLGDRPRRVVLWEERGEQGSYAIVPLVDHGFGFVPTRTPPAQVFRYPNRTSNFEMLEWLGVSVLVSRDRHRSHDELQLLGEVDNHFVYRMQSDPSWPVKVEGGGEAEVVSWEPHRRVLRVRGTTAASALILGQPPYDKWHAAQDGEELPVSDYKGMSGFRFTAIAPVHDGDVVVWYQDTDKEIGWGIAALVVVGLALLATLFFWVPLPRIVRGRGLAVLSIAGVVATSAVAGYGLHRLSALGDEAIDNFWLDEEPAGSEVVEVIHQRMPDWWERDPSFYCVRPYTRTQDPECEDSDLAPVLVRGRERRHRDERLVPHDPPRPMLELPSCLRFGVPTEGRARVVWNVPPGATAVRGRVRTENGFDSVGRAEAGGRTLGEVRSNDAVFRYDLPPGAERFALEMRPTGSRTSLTCFEGVFLRTP